jgi:hypothetical protein
MRHRNLLAPGLALALALALGPNPAMAAVQMATGSASSSDGSLAASATFTTSTNQVVVTLTNTLSPSAFVSPGQALSDITFTLSNPTTTTNFTGSTAAGQFGNVTGSTPGVVTYVSTDAQTGNTTPVRWFANGSVSGSTVTLETIGGGQPSQMIAPLVPNGGTYPNSNGGVPNFNSYVIGPATFTLNLAGVTATTTVTAATFSFGTGPDHFVTGTIVTPPIPEPSTMIMAALGAVGFLGYGVRRRPKT